MKFFNSNKWQYRLLRTVVQAVIGFLIANIDFIIGNFSISPEWKTIIVGLCMAILSPIMAEIGKVDTETGDNK